MVAPWSRLELRAIPAPGMMMATAAKKHLTIFYRRRHPRTPGGRPAVKQAFREEAGKTLGIPLRGQRNVLVQSGMAGRGLRTNITYKRSHSKHPGLAGKFYKLSPGQTVGSALAVAGGNLDAILTTSRTYTK